MSTRITFVLGGAASGKSAFAEALTRQAGLPLIYLATAEAGDAEMRRKVADHVRQRGPGWRTIESPTDTATDLRSLPAGHACLLDCMTMWLNNQMMADAPLDPAMDDLFAAMVECRADLFVVSNEVGQGIVPEHALSRRFREAQGRLNIRLAALADTVVQVTAGLPMVLKGNLP